MRSALHVFLHCPAPLCRSRTFALFWPLPGLAAAHLGRESGASMMSFVHPRCQLWVQFVQDTAVDKQTQCRESCLDLPPCPASIWRSESERGRRMITCFCPAIGRKAWLGACVAIAGLSGNPRHCRLLCVGFVPAHRPLHAELEVLSAG